MAGEKSPRSESRIRSTLGFLYTQALTANQNTNQGGIRVMRMTNEGFPVGGHGHFVSTIFDGVATIDDGSAEDSAEFDVGERNDLIITVENGQDGAVTASLFGRYEAAGPAFLLKNYGSIPAGVTPNPETLTDPWKFLFMRAQSDSAFQSAGFVVKLQEQT